MHNNGLLGWIKARHEKLCRLIYFDWTQWLDKIWFLSEWLPIWTKVLQKWDLYFLVTSSSHDKNWGEWSRAHVPSYSLIRFIRRLRGLVLLGPVTKDKKKDKKKILEPWHEISNNVVYATSKGSDQPVHTRSLVRAFASRLNISMSVKLLTKHHFDI